MISALASYILSLSLSSSQKRKFRDDLILVRKVISGCSDPGSLDHYQRQLLDLLLHDAPATPYRVIEAMIDRYHWSLNMSMDELHERAIQDEIIESRRWWSEGRTLDKLHEEALELDPDNGLEDWS